MSKKANNITKVKKVAFIHKELDYALRVVLAKKELTYTDWVRTKAEEEING